MKEIHASEFGITAEKDISQELVKLLDYAKTIDGEKTVVFQKGTYYIDSHRCQQHMLYITNTVGDKEFKSGETPHLNSVAFYFGQTNDLTVDGNGAIFVIDGKVTNIAIENCKNLTLKNLEIRHAHPDMHEFKVVKKSLFTVDFELDKDSLYSVKDGKLYFKAKDYSFCASRNTSAWWIGLIRQETPNKIERVSHPMFSSLKTTDLGNGRIKVTYPSTKKFKEGDRIYLFDVRRQFAGIFINKSENISLYNIKQRFNYSLAYVAQDSERLTIEGCEFAPEEGSARKMSSVADFIQLCMCRGDISVRGCYFDGAGDDCLNVHGIHFKITDVKDNVITVRFMHPQSHGFNPLRVGDEIAYISTDTLLEKGTAVIENSELIGEYVIKLTVSDTSKAKVGDVIEDVTACPNLSFTDNTATRIITRGLLITTRGKVNVENNHFLSTTMSGILLSDDAKSWYESGMCKDVTIKNNVFDYCGQTPILIKPENARYEGAVHKNVKIIGNTFKNYSGECINAKATDGLYIEGNSFASDNKLKTSNCENVVVK